VEFVKELVLKATYLVMCKRMILIFSAREQIF